jgi:CRISPR/Cas system CMR subunit Cmr6 (Cas7 group RAMP superfamily)
VERRLSVSSFYQYSAYYDEIPLDKKILEDSLPEPLKKKLVSNTKLALRKRSDALKYLHTLNKHIEKMQQEELKDKLREFVHIESERAHVSIKSIRCSVNSYTIGDGYPLFLPDSLHIKVMCSIDAREQAIKGKVIFDRKELERFISMVFTEFDKDS